MTTYNNKQVLLGFSGGIDSSACIEILKQQNYKITALYIDTLGDKDQIELVKAKAKDLNLDLVVENRVDAFRSEVINYFTSSYFMGRTPAPCTLCNAAIKWSTLDAVSRRLGIDTLSTGHYFGIKNHEDKLYIVKGLDPIKDQSYYLWNIPRHLLERIITPMYDKIKSQVKQEYNMTNMRESMGVCFLRGRSYIDLLKEQYPTLIQKGEIINSCGKVIGSHDGFPFYTIGQKKGLNISDKSKKYCITHIDASNNTLTVGEDKDLFFNNLTIANCNVVDVDELLSCDDCRVIIRGLGRNPEGFSTITKNGDGFDILLEGEAWAPALGQPVVIYRDDRVVAGGILEKYW